MDNWFSENFKGDRIEKLKRKLITETQRYYNITGENDLEDICIAGSRIFPKKFQIYLWDRSDLDVIVFLKKNVKPKTKTQIIHSQFTFENLRVSVRFAYNYLLKDWKVGYFGRKFPFYSLFEEKYYFPDDFDKTFFKWLAIKFGIVLNSFDDVKCFLCGKKLNGNDNIHFVRFSLLRSNRNIRYDKRGIVCEGCFENLKKIFSKFQNFYDNFFKKGG